MTTIEQALTLGVTDCARCGGKHEGPLAWKVFERPVDHYVYWVPCPTNGDPILLRVEWNETDESLTALARKKFAEATGG